ncbi:MAG: SOS cell division inhibitor SulA [Acidiferrobacteraceae bacterium]|nr:SOS cell division inhibitor SulA [Acidiferrobacteraceae bacterium]|tara:strand:+ start:887 stop:1501 length:615 start_codon:yes stop_codon:yes gene_type:complete
MKIDLINKNRAVSKGLSGIKNYPILPTGYTELDQYLPGGGWPLGTLIEILIRRMEEVPLWLIIPALQQLNNDSRWQAWISPIHIPYAPALMSAGIDLSKVLILNPPTHKDVVWTIEQCLSSGVCSAVIFWLQTLTNKNSRRFKLAAKHGDSWGICFCLLDHAQHETVSSLKLSYRPTRHGADINILRCTGKKPNKNLQINRTIT